MPIGPTGVFPRTDLRATLRERTTSRNLWVAMRVLPALMVAEKAGSLVSLPGWNNGQIPDMARAPGGGYPRLVWAIEEQTYSCKEFGAEAAVDDAHRARYGNFLEMDAEVAQILQDTIDIRLERAAAAALFNTTTFTGAGYTSGVGTEWNTYATATPATDIIAPCDTLRQRTGCPQIMQGLLMSEKVARNVCRTADFRTAMKIDSQPLGAMWDEKLLALYFGVKEVVVGRSSYNSANINQAEAFVDIWDDEYVLIYVPSEGRMVGGAEIGRCIAWEQNGGILTVENYRENAVRGDVLRVRQDVDVKVWGATWGYLLSNITT